MHARHELERRVADFYATENRPRAPDRVLGEAVAAIETARQRRAPVRVPWWAPTGKAYAGVAVAAVIVLSVWAIGLAMLTGDTIPGDQLGWTPERLVQDWPVPARPEPPGEVTVAQMVLGDDAHWDEGGWEGLDYADPVGDVPAGANWLDIREVGLSPMGTPAFGIDLASGFPSPITGPGERWIAYGLVLDTDLDGTPDLRIGMDNIQGGGHRAWRTELDTGETQAKAGGGYGWVGEEKGGTGTGYSSLDTYYPGDPDGLRDRASFWYSLKEDEQTYRFYAWASMIEDGRHIATDYAPDVGWLEEGDQPVVPLVGPTWEVESPVVQDGEAFMLVQSISISADGEIAFDAGCSTGRGRWRSTRTGSA